MEFQIRGGVHQVTSHWYLSKIKNNLKIVFPLNAHKGSDHRVCILCFFISTILSLMLFPKMYASPLVGFKSPSRVLIVVVFPDPFGPEKTKNLTLFY